MIAIDTNLLLRLVLDDDPAQQARVNALLKTGQLFTAPATVLLELVWVLQSRGFSAAHIVHGLTTLLEIPNFKPEHDIAIREALHGYQAGMDFADALHLALSSKQQQFMTFDKTFASKAKKLGLRPAVALA
jgi:predicted nucleic-acid-binding protein